MKRILSLSLMALAVGAERYIAVDNVCAWPNVKRLADGSLVAVIFNQPNHGLTEGDVEAWVSRDGGKLWKLAGVPAPHEPGTLRLNVAFGVAHDGSLIVLSAGALAEKRAALWLPVWVCRSSDGGKSWSRASAVQLPDGRDYLIPFGDIVQLPGRRLAASFYYDYRYTAVGKSSGPPRKERGGSAYVLFSNDDGRTWGDAVMLGKDDYNETTLLRLSDRRMLAASRTYKDGRLDLFVSADEGRTWRNQGPLSMPSHHPASLLRLSDGRILVTYGIREKGSLAVGVRVSRDEGETWGAPWPIVPIGPARDGGYPSTVQLEDGTLVTAWYASSIPSHERYHMGVLRWKLEADGR